MFFSWTDLSIWFRKKFTERFLVERPARNESSSFSSSSSSAKIAWPSEDEDEDEDEKQKRLHPGKTENEGIQRILPKTVRQAGLILLFDGEVDPALAGPDEHSQTGILTSASNRLPAFPIRVGGNFGEFVAVTVAQPSRIFTGFPDI